MAARVDFYVLSSGGPDARLQCACRLAETAVEQGARIYARTSSADQARRLDDLLWTWRDGSFLPHELYKGSAASQGLVHVLLGELAGPDSHCDLLINLTDTLPEDLERYARVAEIVDVEPDHKRAARERYRQYRERGCALETHNV